MNKFPLVINLLLASLLFQSAHSLPAKPNKCPSVSAIQSRGLDLAMYTTDGFVTGVAGERYDTNAVFTFAIGRIYAQDEASAKSLAQKALATLQFKQGPTYESLTNTWTCTYSTYDGDGFPAQAWTPGNH